MHSNGPWATLIAITSTVISVLPVFWLGSLSTFVQSDLALGPATLGLCVAAFFGTSGLSAGLCGRLVQRIGSNPGIAVSALLSGSSLACTSVAQSSGHVMAMMAVAGVGNALGQPAANLMLGRQVSYRRLGAMMGLKQSAVPVSIVLAGLAVPTLVRFSGWRATYATFAVLAVAFSVYVARQHVRVSAGASSRSDPAQPHDWKALRWMAVGVGLGSAAGTSAGAFLVPAAIDSGIDPVRAAGISSVAGALAIGSRLILGWRADRISLRGPWRPMRLVGLLLLTGSTGPFLLFTQYPIAMGAGAVITYALGWGWVGLMYYAVVTGYRGHVAVASGIAQMGLSGGACIGPLAFGLIAENLSYRASWLSIGLMCLVAGTLCSYLAGRTPPTTPPRRFEPGPGLGPSAT